MTKKLANKDGRNKRCNTEINNPCTQRYFFIYILKETASKFLSCAILTVICVQCL